MLVLLGGGVRGTLVRLLGELTLEMECFMVLRISFGFEMGIDGVGFCLGHTEIRGMCYQDMSKRQGTRL
jgi:hypothetical protein